MKNIILLVCASAFTTFIYNHITGANGNENTPKLLSFADYHFNSFNSSFPQNHNMGDFVNMLDKGNECTLL